MKRYKYTSYNEYRKEQIKTNYKKLNDCWAKEDLIKKLSKYIIKEIVPIIGICHGTRGGYEQIWFEKYIPGCTVYGTEISPSGLSKYNTIIYDFNKRNLKWINKFDFVYSNAWDHAYHFPNTLDIWLETLKENGILILETSSNHEKGKCSSSDPWRITIEEMRKMIPKWTNGKWSIVKEIKDLKNIRSIFLIIRRLIDGNY